MSRSELSYTSPETQARWRALVSAFESSGLSMPAFCQREGIAESTLYAWRARLRGGRHPAKTGLPIRGDFVQLGLMGAGSAPALTSPTRTGAAVDIKLDLGAGVVLHLRRG